MCVVWQQIPVKMKAISKLKELPNTAVIDFLGFAIISV